MDFGKKYLTYEEYKELGGTLSVSPFDILEYEARRVIDEKTQMRLRNVDTIPMEVKMCMNRLIEKVYSYTEGTEQTQNKNIASESIDGYSVSYISASDIQNIIVSKNKELEDIVTTYLMNVVVNKEHLLYLGVK